MLYFCKLEFFFSIWLVYQVKIVNEIMMRNVRLRKILPVIQGEKKKTFGLCVVAIWFHSYIVMNHFIHFMDICWLTILCQAFR